MARSDENDQPKKCDAPDAWLTCDKSSSTPGRTASKSAKPLTSSYSSLERSTKSKRKRLTCPCRRRGESGRVFGGSLTVGQGRRGCGDTAGPGAVVHSAAASPELAPTAGSWTFALERYRRRCGGAPPVLHGGFALSSAEQSGRVDRRHIVDHAGG